MIELIPSKDVRDFVVKTDWIFSDFEKAEIIYHMDLPYDEMKTELQKISDQTDDEMLKTQIIEHIERDQKCIQLFKENCEGFMYAVEVDEKDTPCESYICGYFAEADLAYTHGKKQGCKFDIQKYQIVGFIGREAIKPKGYINPYLFTDKNPDELILEYEYDGGYVAEFRFDKKGQLIGFYSDEVEITDQFDPSRFENAYIEVPNPFEEGDRVKLIETDLCGIVRTSQKEWKKYNEEMKTSDCADYEDVGIIVDFFMDNKKTTHGHFCPIFLEKVEENQNDETE
ncbi:hypothetical protein GH808_06285 [Acetobacterium fimetarium]|uniref:Uncharacterized protein n=1 Tax=Acetobacterium fimetarium TaxID=52691 RepID=A0ABR6WV01_9FIRM|nr:hypothetical protein [Acetobacterium fimetarium]MBC3804044.1 hypothetical protein [Acetobacterium fimetarium]